ncbi:hypothetical protein NYE59_22990 [Paenibacillus sp. FSL L8-0323]|uniref:hypothetical protein n=1 Tax=Paenibacillus sp. FSL L8-0323 TaxID=2975330 RepID=UPI0030FB581F
MLKFFYRILPIALVIFILGVSVPVSAADVPSNIQSETRKFTSDYMDLDGNIVGEQIKTITIDAPVYDSEGTKSVTITEKVTYNFDNNFEFKDKIKGETLVNVFSVDTEGNNYVNNELIVVEPYEEPIMSTMDVGGHWKYTYYNADSSTQAYLYTGSGVSLDMRDVKNAYKSVYLTKNTANNPTISDFKMYATQVSNAHDSYYSWGGAYALEVAGVVAAVPYINALAAIVAGGVVVWSAYQGYSAWQTMNQAMANAYSII